jgi:hypothetical protein
MNKDIYRKIAIALIMLMLGYAGNVIAAQFDLRERVVILETGFTFVVERVNEAIEKMEHLDEHFHYGPPKPEDEGGE